MRLTLTRARLNYEPASPAIEGAWSRAESGSARRKNEAPA